MNWYELATAQETEKVLSSLYRINWDSETEWVHHIFEDEPKSEYKYPVNFEIAEALWGESIYGDETSEWVYTPSELEKVS